MALAPDPPIFGQTYTDNNGINYVWTTNFTWERAGLDYLYSEPPTPAIIIPAANGDHAQFSTIDAQIGTGITMDTASPYSIVPGAPSVGRFTLAQGKRFLIRAHSKERPIGGKNRFHKFQIFNHVTGLPVGNAGCTMSTNKPRENSHDNIANAIVDTTNGIENLELRKLSGLATNEFRYSVGVLVGVWVEIKEIRQY